MGISLSFSEVCRFCSLWNYNKTKIKKQQQLCFKVKCLSKDECLHRHGEMVLRVSTEVKTRPAESDSDPDF